MRSFVVHTTAKDIRVKLEQRGAGTHFHATFYHRGRRFRESTHCAVLAGAERNARQLVLEALTARPAGDALTVAAAVKRYLSERWPGQNSEESQTHRDFNSRLAILAKTMGPDTDLAAFNYDQATAFTQRFIELKKQADRIGPQSQLNYRNVLSRFYAWLLRTRGDNGQPLVNWRFNPASRQEVPIPKIARKLQPPLSETQIQRWLQLARGSALWPSALVCLGAGARPIEAARLAWEHVDLDASEIVLNGKNRARRIKISAWLLAHLKALKRKRARPMVCAPNKRAQDAQLQRFKNKHGLGKEFTLQALRRTASCRAAPSMTPLEYADYFGHSLSVAQAHYFGYGLTLKNDVAQVLDFSPRTATKTATKQARKRA